LNLKKPCSLSENLNQAYGGSHILRGLSFEVKTGEVTTLLGRNGVGKTTLLKSLMGLVKTKSGSITFDGKDITHLPPHERVKAGIGYVPQGREIFPRLTVEENLLMGLATKPGQHRIPERIFDMFPVSSR
jgi:urea transport system ATP-binding protein